MTFTRNLLSWYQIHNRSLPWRETKDPYKIWLSEIILQQTRIEQGMEYYFKFIENFPTVKELALADEDQVLKLWEGLGYYSRARNLHFSAKYIMNECEGKFPTTYKEILKLKGVGVYTASAIASICFNEYEPVVDGNVYRFLSRLFNISTPINTPASLKEFRQLANEYIKLAEKPGDFNQALMEFGAIWCKPANPKCEECVFRAKCESYHRGLVTERPVKPKKIKITDRFFNFLIPKDSDFVYIEKRESAKDIWRNLFQLPLIETKDSNSDLSFELKTKNFETVHSVKHKLSHQNLHISFIEVKENYFKGKNAYTKIKKMDFVQYAFPKPIKEFLESL